MGSAPRYDKIAEWYDAEFATSALGDSARTTEEPEDRDYPHIVALRARR